MLATGPPVDRLQQQPRFPPMQTTPNHQPPPPTPPLQHYPLPPSRYHHTPPSGYPAYRPPANAPDARLPPRLSIGPPQQPPPPPPSLQQAQAQQVPPPQLLKRPPSQNFAGETPPKKKQSKWTAEEDREIIGLRGEGKKWEDISKLLPGRSAISCRLRFQNYLERRSEWDEEKKNKLARLYERFKKDMWEKIAKEMQLPWRAAEAMHWHIGEAEMAQRANVQVFTLAGQPQLGTATITTGPSQATGVDAGAAGGNGGGGGSTSPQSATGSGAPVPGVVTYSHSHNHSLPQLPPHVLGHPLSPVEHFRRNSLGALSSPGRSEGGIRRRADSTRSAASAYPRASLPPLEDIANPGLRERDRDPRPKFPPSW